MNCYGLVMTQSKSERLSNGYRAWLDVGYTNHKCERALNALMRSLDLTLAQHEVLVRIHRHSGLSQQALSKKLLVAKSNVSSLLKKLEARGLVDRTTDSRDSRNKTLALTQTGRAVLEHSMALQQRVIDAMMSKLSDREIQQTRTIMEKVSAGLDGLDLNAG